MNATCHGNVETARRHLIFDLQQQQQPNKSVRTEVLPFSYISYFRINLNFFVNLNTGSTCERDHVWG